MSISTRESDIPKMASGSQDGAAGQTLRAHSMAAIYWQRFRRHRMALVGATFLLILVLGSSVGPLLFSRDAAMQPNLLSVSLPPSPTRWLGTDEVGRDILVRLLLGGRVSLSVGFFSMALAMVIGITLGSLAGYAGGWTDHITMRFTDFMLCIPTFFLIIAVSVVFGPSFKTVVISIGALSWMSICRVTRAGFLSLKEQEFVYAARSLGAGHARLIFQHIIPNTLAPVIVAATLCVGSAIMNETAVSYLGLGIPPPTPSWGNMLRNAQDQMWNAPWIAIFPGLAILLSVLATNFIGDGLRDALDPRLAKRKT